MRLELRKISMLLALVSALGFSGMASANLVVNGGFEAPDVANGDWDPLDPDNVPGWLADPDTIEIWDSLNGVVSAEGEQHAELNSHNGSGPFNLWQSIDTVAGNDYLFSFAYSARNPNGSEKFVASLFDGNITTEAGFDGLSNIVTSGTIINDSSAWKYFSISFTAVSEFTTIAFKSVSPNGTVGNFIDDVSVVSAPATLVLFGTLVGAFLFVRRK